MLRYSVTLLLAWTAFLLGYWALGLALGIQGTYAYPYRAAGPFLAPSLDLGRRPGGAALVPQRHFR
jgi:hypothetical protein